MNIFGIRWLLPAVLCLIAGCRSGYQPDTTLIQSMTSAYLAKQPLANLPANLDMSQALRIQEEFVATLVPAFGPPVGYKVGLVTRESQERFGLNGPVRGRLLSHMLLADGAEVAADFGVAPLCEADMLVVVKDAGINRAEGLLDVVRHLKEVVAFIELPDSYLSTNQPVTGEKLVAANVGARLGVLGTRAPVEPTLEFIDALANVSITMADQMGNEYVRAPGKDILGHPLHAVLWLLEELKKSGKRLEAGDMISLGGLAMITPQRGQTIKLTYIGLPGTPLRAQVTFN